MRRNSRANQGNCALHSRFESLEPRQLLSIAPAGIGPQAVVDSFTGVEDQALTGNVLANDVIAEGELPVVQSWPVNGTLEFTEENGSFTYTPNADFYGTDLFIYTYGDSEAAVILNVEAENDAPTAQGFEVTRAPGATVRIDALAWADDIDGDGLWLSVAAQPSNGTVTVKHNGTPLDPTDDYLLYTPAQWSLADDVFSFTVDDGSGPITPVQVAVNVSGAGLVASPKSPRVKDLVVVGTSENDNILIARKGNSIRVVMNQRVLGTFRTTGRIIAKGLAGDDTIAALNLKQGVSFYGGEGNDRLIGTTYADRLEGGADNDILVSFGGNDSLISDGNDIVKKRRGL